jgi:integrase
VIKLAAGSPLPQVLAAADAQAILDACEHLRDRLLMGLLLDTGMRIGEALGLRHEDMDIGACEVQVMPRENANGARAKSERLRVIPCGVPLMRLYADYLNRVPGDRLRLRVRQLMGWPGGPAAALPGCL